MSFPRYPEYKDSGVEWLGEVPAHWDVKRLRFVANLNPPKAEIRGRHADTEVSFLPMEAVGDDGRINLDQIRPLAEVLEGYTYLREGDVAFAKITPCFENGKGAIMRGLRNGIALGTTELTVIRPEHDRSVSDYLFRVISSGEFRSLGEASMYGAGGQKRVSDDYVRNFAIAWPPLDEQSTIAAFLDHETAKIDALVEEQKRLIELLKEKRQAVISHAVTKGLDPNVPMKNSGVEWLGEVPAHWEVLQLKRMLSDIAYGISESSQAEGRYEVIGMGDVQDGQIVPPGQRFVDDVDAALLLKPGDILFNRTNSLDLVGKCGILESDMVVTFASYLVRFRTKFDVCPDYLNSLLNTQAVLNHARGLALPSIGQANLNPNRYGYTHLCRPPLSEQKEIAKFLNEQVGALDQLVREAQQAIELIKEHRSALISAAVTGKIDVRGWKPPGTTHATSQHARETA